MKDFAPLIGKRINTISWKQNENNRPVLYIGFTDLTFCLICSLHDRLEVTIHESGSLTAIQNITLPALPGGFQKDSAKLQDNSEAQQFNRDLITVVSQC